MLPKPVPVTRVQLLALLLEYTVRKYTNNSIVLPSVDQYPNLTLKNINDCVIRPNVNNKNDNRTRPIVT